MITLIGGLLTILTGSEGYNAVGNTNHNLLTFGGTIVYSAQKIGWPSLGTFFTYAMVEGILIGVASLVMLFAFYKNRAKLALGASIFGGLIAIYAFLSYWLTFGPMTSGPALAFIGSLLCAVYISKK